MRMQRWRVWECAVLVVAVLLALPAATLAKNPCVPLRGTITGQFDLDVGWVGQAYLAFDDGAPYYATLVDVGIGSPEHPDPFEVFRSGNFSGSEMLTFTVEGFGSFVYYGDFMAMEGVGPFAYGFSEKGFIDPNSGTGGFTGLSGHLSIHGSFVAGMDFPPPPERPWVWIAEITGSACGM